MDVRSTSLEAQIDPFGTDPPDSRVSVPPTWVSAVVTPFWRAPVKLILTSDSVGPAAKSLDELLQEDQIERLHGGDHEISHFEGIGRVGVRHCQCAQSRRAGRLEAPV